MSMLNDLKKTHTYGLLPTSDTPQDIEAVRRFAREVLQGDSKSIQYISQYIRRSYNTVFIMYCLLFLVGLATAIAAIIKGFMAHTGTEAIPSLIFAGLSAASFFTLFITRPLESLERNAFFSSWLIAIMNNYWTWLMYLKDPKTIDSDLKDTIASLTSELSDLADKYALAIGKYPALTATATEDGDKANASQETKNKKQEE